MTEQFELPLAFAAQPKRPERPSKGRRSIDWMAAAALRTGAATSVNDLLDQVAAVRDEALFNALLAVLQYPHAIMLCSASEWEEKWGRRIAPGQRPLLLMVPFGPVELVFDVSQTEATERAKRLPFNDSPFGMDPVARADEAVGRLIAGVQTMGVRVVDMRQGTRLAGHIQRMGDAGFMQVGAKERGAPTTHVPVRWVVGLNHRHSATEKLATLAHELGHLFCGHVGADRGDSWPHRSALSAVQEEFEAESVARLVFRRVAPGVVLPPYLENILDPDAPVPDEGWSYVVQAADRILHMLS